MFVNTWKKNIQKFKNRNIIYGHLTPKIDWFQISGVDVWTRVPKRSILSLLQYIRCCFYVINVRPPWNEGRGNAGIPVHPPFLQVVETLLNEVRLRQFQGRHHNGSRHNCCIQRSCIPVRRIIVKFPQWENGYGLTLYLYGERWVNRYHDTALFKFTKIFLG